MPKMKLGAAFYAVIAVGWVVSAIATYRGYAAYRDADEWFLIAMGTVFLLTGVLFGIGAVTRRGLMSDDGPRICRSGWQVVIVLVCAGFVVYLLGDDWGTPFPNGVAAFIPGFVQRLQDKYYEGRQEAERELNPEEPDGVRPPTA
jgi:peptidoglycan/LPS O-acetylase OafA/YrhL